MVHYLILSSLLSHFIFQHEILTRQHDLNMQINFFSQSIFFLWYIMQLSALFSFGRNTFINAERSGLKLLLTLPAMTMKAASTLLIILLISGCVENSFQRVFTFTKKGYQSLMNAVTGKYTYILCYISN